MLIIDGYDDVNGLGANGYGQIIASDYRLNNNKLNSSDGRHKNQSVTLAVATTVDAGDQFIINKSEGASYKTSVIIPANLGPQTGPFAFTE